MLRGLGGPNQKTHTARDGDPAARATRLCAALPWLAVGAALLPVLLDGFPRGQDWRLELVRVAEYQSALRAGQLPPYWAENLYAGYGSPVFLFYAPLFAALAALFSALAGSALTGATAALVLVSIAAVPLSLAAFREVARQALPASTATARSEAADSAARIATAFYVLAPYLVADRFARNANAELSALCLMPALLYGLMVAERRPRRGLASLSVGLALVVLAHNLSALLATAGVVLGALLLHARRGHLRGLVVCATGIGLGLGLSLFFWLPAMLLRERIRTEELLVGRFDFHQNFDAWTTVFGYDAFYAAGALGIGVLVAGAASLVLRAREPDAQEPRALLAFGLLSSAGLLFLTHEASVRVWEAVPFLPLFQFPWRMLGPLALTTALLLACVAAPLLQRQPAARRAGLEVALFALCLANALPALTSYRPLTEEIRDHLEVALRPAAIRVGRQSVSVRDEYLPRNADRRVWLRERPVRHQGAVVASTSPGAIEPVRDGGTRIALTVESETPTRIRLARFHTPEWTATLDGGRIPVHRSPTGSLEVDLPAGRHDLRVELAPPRARSLGLLASAGAGVVLIGLLIVLPRDRSSGPSD